MLLKVFLIMIFLGVCGFRYNAPLQPQISFSKHNTQAKILPQIHNIINQL